MSEEENQNEKSVDVEGTAKTAIPAEASADREAAPAASAATGTNGAAERRRVLRKTRIGVVVSDKMEKTIVVNVVRRVSHPVFKKIVKRTTKLYAHDENREAKVGDKVLIMETKPISKKKRWRLTKVLTH